MRYELEQNKRLTKKTMLFTRLPNLILSGGHWLRCSPPCPKLDSSQARGASLGVSGSLTRHSVGQVSCSWPASVPYIIQHVFSKVSLRTREEMGHSYGLKTNFESSKKRSQSVLFPASQNDLFSFLTYVAYLIRLTLFCCQIHSSVGQGRCVFPFNPFMALS